MRFFRYLIYGIIFSIILIKVEAVSWFRIQEMFYFQSFHMFGVLFSAIGVALVGVQLIKIRNKSLNENNKIPFQPKPLRWKANLIGGVLFGIGWAITGACPGPIYALIGLNIFPAIVVLFGALLGTFLYLNIKNKLPN